MWLQATPLSESFLVFFVLILVGESLLINKTVIYVITSDTIVGELLLSRSAEDGAKPSQRLALRIHSFPE